MSEATFRHVVMFKWDTEKASAEHRAGVGAELDKMAKSIDTIVSFKHGKDAGLSESNFDYVLVVDFANEEGYVTYRDSPAHQEFLTKNIKGFIQNRSAVQHKL
eukprot:m.180755 g.180755  ORF g.180755 m.180755 type:complete len:103 (-) comp15502_c0_seq4:2150-2458(-)